MIRRLATAFALVSTLATPASAQSVDQIVATWTRLRAIEMYCPKFYRVDAQYLRDLQNVFEEAGTKAGGVTEARVRKAGAQREAEIIAAGAKKWCAKWRTKMRTEGGAEVWP